MFAYNTFKHTEGYEAGVPGLVLAAEAFRRNGETERQRFAEGLIDSAAKQMLTMQDECGGVITMANELADDGIGKGPMSNSRGRYDNNQLGEWMRALNYIALYYREVPEKSEFVKKLNDVCRKAGDFIVQYSLRESDGIGGVLRHVLMRFGQRDRNKRTNQRHYCDATRYGGGCIVRLRNVLFLCGESQELLHPHLEAGVSAICVRGVGR